jgi:hypothetical protein
VRSTPDPCNTALFLGKFNQHQLFVSPQKQGEVVHPSGPWRASYENDDYHQTARQDEQPPKLYV